MQDNQVHAVARPLAPDPQWERYQSVSSLLTYSAFTRILHV
jgi:hypothetical protein